MTTKIKDWTGYRLIFSSVSADPLDGIDIIRKHSPDSYIVSWRGGYVGVLSSKSVNVYAKEATIIHPKSVVIKKFFEDA